MSLAGMSPAVRMDSPSSTIIHLHLKNSSSIHLSCALCLVLCFFCLEGALRQPWLLKPAKVNPLLWMFLQGWGAAGWSWLPTSSITAPGWAEGGINGFLGFFTTSETKQSGMKHFLKISMIVNQHFKFSRSKWYCKSSYLYLTHLYLNFYLLTPLIWQKASSYQDLYPMTLWPGVVISERACCSSTHMVRQGPPLQRGRRVPALSHAALRRDGRHAKACVGVERKGTMLVMNGTLRRCDDKMFCWMLDVFMTYQ